VFSVWQPSSHEISIDLSLMARHQDWQTFLRGMSVIIADFPGGISSPMSVAYTMVETIASRSKEDPAFAETSKTRQGCDPLFIVPDQSIQHGHQHE